LKLVLLSGGSGKRLWPLSNDTRSKQFLKILESKTQKSERVSMIQRVWEQLESASLADSSIIATSKIQREMIHNQLGLNIPIVTEPERRDTFPAIALSASYLYSIQSISREEVISVLPVDPYVEEDFFHRVKELENVLDEGDADLALMGVKPNYPSSKYGYIVPSKQKNNYIVVSHFSEKPTEDKAKSLIEENSLWNCGVFAFKLGYLLDLLQDMGLPIEYDQLITEYSSLPKISFDYEVVEKAEKMVAIPYEGDWKDLGTWNTLTEEMTSNQIGKGVISEDSTNTNLINELDIPVTVLGAKDLIVAASPDGILISDKASSPKIKDFIKEFNQPPMYEERVWGWSKTLDYSTYESGEEMVTKRICIEEGKNSSYHYHNLRDEVWTIVKGKGELALDSKITNVKAGDIIHLPVGKKHGIKALSELEFIEVQTGLEISEKDFIRLSFEWKDIVSQFSSSKPQVIL